MQIRGGMLSERQKRTICEMKCSPRLGLIRITLLDLSRQTPGLFDVLVVLRAVAGRTFGGRGPLECEAGRQIQGRFELGAAVTHRAAKPARLAPYWHTMWRASHGNDTAATHAQSEVQ